MPQAVSCPNCAAALAGPVERCPQCQEPLAVDQDVTRAPLTLAATRPSSHGRPPSSSSGWLTSSDAIDHGRFAPGAVLGARYRIVGRLGRGGMGEVYRADDLKLGQPVALKFLPVDFDRDPARLMQLHGEVRMARQVAHPNVCRVYDIDEVEGTVFLSMEFVDGEDLASLLRRIGRFPVDRAVEIARQIAAGLAAAHERGVVHRDLKPANVMIDGAGKVRLTDFGLAGVSGQVIRAGTPAYMAPEQLVGQEVTARSDVFAFGLVMYELFTGKRALEAKTVAELIQKHDDGNLLPPSSVVADLTPDIDRAIMRCLGRDPTSRPASALAAAAALPGGDLLAAALAAGETPSPEMVAAAGTSEVISTRAAALAAACVVVGLAALTVSYQQVLLVNRVLLDRPPAVLADRAQELLASIGYPGSGQATASGLGLSPTDYLLHVSATSSERDRWDVLRQPWPAAVYFWYRTSPRPLIPIGTEARVGSGNPPLIFSGQVTLLTDTAGKLLELHAVPPQVDLDAAAAAPTDWGRLFAVAGLSIDGFTPVEPQWLPRNFADERRAWTGTHSGSKIPIRIEAASYRGKPVDFIMVAPWSRATRMQSARVSGFDAAIEALAGLIMPALFVAAAVLARRNWRLGRGDRRGAGKAAAVTFGLLIAGWLLTATYVADIGLEAQRVFAAIGGVMFATAVLWLAYLGLEPFVRRYWPDSLIAWSRVTTGQWNDPRVGRDVLLGICAGLAMTLAFAVHNLLPVLAGQPEPIPLGRNLLWLSGLRETLGTTLLQIGEALQAAMIATFGVVLLLNLLKRLWLAALAAIICYTPLVISGLFMPGTPILDLVIGVVIISIFVGVIIRFGLLASVAAISTHFVLLATPLTTDFGSWRGGVTVWVLALVGGTALLSLRLARTMVRVGR